MASLAFTLALTALLVANQSVPRASAQDKDFDIAGEWLSDGKVDRPCAIFRQGHVLLLVNDAGNLGTARLHREGRKLIVLKGEGWDPGLEAEVHDNGRRLKWSNGSVWIRR